MIHAKGQEPKRSLDKIAYIANILVNKNNDHPVFKLQPGAFKKLETKYITSRLAN